MLYKKDTNKVRTLISCLARKVKTKSLFKIFDQIFKITKNILLMNDLKKKDL